VSDLYSISAAIVIRELCQSLYQLCGYYCSMFGISTAGYNLRIYMHRMLQYCAA